ncbi:MAG: site-2 protease family protein [Thermoplasmata archaeon]
MKFTIRKEELNDIIIAILGLSLAFMFAFFCNFLNYNASCFEHPVMIIIYYLIAMLGVVTAFFGHEMMHKYVAMRNGYYAEFRKWDLGLLISIITGMIGFVFAFPGATMIYGWLDKKTDGLVSIAGPVYNLVLGLFFIGISFISKVLFLNEILFFLGQINIWISMFNMLPIPPLDGSKVLRWNVTVWAIVFAIAIGLAVKFVFLI